MDSNKNTAEKVALNVIWFYILARAVGVGVWHGLDCPFDLTAIFKSYEYLFYTLGGVFVLMGTMALFRTSR